MADTKHTGKDLVGKDDQALAATPENTIQLGNTNSISTVGLTGKQVEQLRMKHAEGMVDLNKKAQELKIDVGALDATLGTMADQTKQVSEAGDHVTMTHSQSSAIGRTEVVMGNTEKAAQGKLTKSQTGEDDNTLKYVIIGAVVAIVIALVAFN